MRPYVSTMAGRKRSCWASRFGNFVLLSVTFRCAAVAAADPWTRRLSSIEGIVGSVTLTSICAFFHFW